jgi:hypothetical protein
VDEPREQLRIVAVAIGLAEQAHERSWRAAHVRLQIRVELVRHRKTRVDRERSLKRLLGAQFAIGHGSDELANHAMASAEMGPRGSKVWIQIQTTLIRFARGLESLIQTGQFVGAEVQLIGAGVVRRVGRGRRHASRERQRQRLDHAPGDVVL